MSVRAQVKTWGDSGDSGCAHDDERLCNACRARTPEEEKAWEKFLEEAEAHGRAFRAANP